MFFCVHVCVHNLHGQNGTKQFLSDCVNKNTCKYLLSSTQGQSENLLNDLFEEPWLKIPPLELVLFSKFALRAFRFCMEDIKLTSRDALLDPYLRLSIFSLTLSLRSLSFMLSTDYAVFWDLGFIQNFITA